MEGERWVKSEEKADEWLAEIIGQFLLEYRYIYIPRKVRLEASRRKRGKNLVRKLMKLMEKVVKPCPEVVPDEEVHLFMLEGLHLGEADGWAQTSRLRAKGDDAYFITADRKALEALELLADEGYVNLKEYIHLLSSSE